MLSWRSRLNFHTEYLLSNDTNYRSNISSFANHHFYGGPNCGRNNNRLYNVRDEQVLKCNNNIYPPTLNAYLIVKTSINELRAYNIKRQFAFI